MSATTTVDRVGWLPELWYVPATLADLECRHGNIGGCSQCQVADRDAEQQLELELEAVK